MCDTNYPLLLKYKDIQLEVSSGEKHLGINIDKKSQIGRTR